MTEEFTFQKFRGNSPAVDGDEGPPGAVRILVNGAGRDLLPGSALSGNEDSGIRRGGPPDEFLDPGETSDSPIIISSAGCFARLALRERFSFMISSIRIARFT